MFYSYKNHSDNVEDTLYSSLTHLTRTVTLYGKPLFQCHHLPILTNGKLVLLKSKGDGVCSDELTLLPAPETKTCSSVLCRQPSGQLSLKAQPTPHAGKLGGLESSVGLFMTYQFHIFCLYACNNKC